MEATTNAYPELIAYDGNGTRVQCTRLASSGSLSKLALDLTGSIPISKDEITRRGAELLVEFDSTLRSCQLQSIYWKYYEK